MTASRVGQVAVSSSLIADAVDDAVHLFDGGDAREVFGELGRGDERGYVLLDVAEAG
jgi:hypothetical protein